MVSVCFKLSLWLGSESHSISKSSSNVATSNSSHIISSRQKEEYGKVAGCSLPQGRAASYL